MTFDPNKHHRRSIRLKGYDYSQNGAYYITICTHNRLCLFGRVVKNTDEAYCDLTEGGKIAQQCWLDIPVHYPAVELDEFVIMPNHIHGILFINRKSVGIFAGVQNFESLPKLNQFQKIIPRSIGAIIRGYEIGVTKWFRQNTDVYTVWQRNYHEHIIRDEADLNRIRQYIFNNPANWETDENYL